MPKTGRMRSHSVISICSDVAIWGDVRFRISLYLGNRDLEFEDYDLPRSRTTDSHTRTRTLTLAQSRTDARTSPCTRTCTGHHSSNGSGASTGACTCTHSPACGTRTCTRNRAVSHSSNGTWNDSPNHSWRPVTSPQLNLTIVAGASNLTADFSWFFPCGIATLA